MQELQRYLAIRINQVKRQKQNTQLEQGYFFPNQQIASNILKQRGVGMGVELVGPDFTTLQVLNVSIESKAWVADPANRICDAPGSWYCVGQQLGDDEHGMKNESLVRKL